MLAEFFTSEVEGGASAAMGGHGMAEALGASLGQAVGGMAAGAGVPGVSVKFLNPGMGGDSARGGGKRGKKKKK